VVSDTLRLSGVFHLTATILSGEKHLTSARNWGLGIGNWGFSDTAPVRCFHLTASVLSGEKHLTSARFRRHYIKKNVNIKFKT